MEERSVLEVSTAGRKRAKARESGRERNRDRKRQQ